jgi:hypothetical protein
MKYSPWVFSFKSTAERLAVGSIEALNYTKNSPNRATKSVKEEGIGSTFCAMDRILYYEKNV